MQEQAPPVDTERNAPAPSMQRAIVIVAAGIAALLIWLVADPIAGVTLEAETGNGNVQRIGPIAILIVTTLAGLLGWALLALLERMTPRARTVWAGIAVLLLLASMIGAWAGTSTGARITLVLMHIAVGVILIGGFVATPGQDTATPARTIRGFPAQRR